MATADLLGVLEQGLAEAKKPRETEIDTDGFEYDVETGEVLGHVDTDPAFRIESREHAEWALGRKADIESRLLAIRARKTALLANLVAQEKGQERRLAWWDFRFRSDLVALARQSLGGKKKSVQFDHGAVSFRSSSGTNEIIDMGAAVRFVEDFAPDEVKKTVTATTVLKAAKAQRESYEDESHKVAVDICLRTFLVSSGPKENVTVSTGVASD